jgi:hypothetical protein
MGKIRAIFNESTKTILKVEDIFTLPLKSLRKIQGSNFRYCLQGERLYVPGYHAEIEKHRLTWIRVDAIDFEYYSDYFVYNKQLEYSIIDLIEKGAQSGTLYSKRHKETKNGREPVSNFIGKLLYDKFTNDPNELRMASKSEFESLAAEVFARRGFEVDLFRDIKDDGIDFLAIKGDGNENHIFCVQCKHPDLEKKNVPVATIREIFGVANAFDIENCMVVTSTDFSNEAKRFAAMKEDRITLVNKMQLTRWLNDYRWESDE